MDGRYRLHLALVVFAIVAVVDVSAHGECTITPINPTTLTTAGGVLASGTVNVTIQCNCTDDNGTVIDVVRWYDPGENRLFDPDTNTNHVAGTPHFSRVNDADDNIILVIPTFNESYDGMYTCGPKGGRKGPPGPPSSAVTLTVGVPCPSLTNPANGMINCSLGDDGFPSLGDTCTVTCDDGYELTGSSTRTCQSNRSWSGSDATCSRVSCPLITGPDNGMIDCSLGSDGDPNPGDTCTVTCNDDFELIGSSIRTCQNNGSWNGSNATCRGVNSQTYTVTIVRVPPGTAVSGMANTYDYPILGTVALTCNVMPDSGSLPNGVTYQWNTDDCYTNDKYTNGNPQCFPHGQTTQTVTGNDLNAEDAGTITCTVTISGSDYTSEPFILRISGVAVTQTQLNLADAITDYSHIDARSGTGGGSFIARCLTGLGPTSTATNANSALGGFYFNGNMIPNSDESASCATDVIQVKPGRGVAGVINLHQCAQFTTAAEGVYTCTMMSSSMMNESVRFGIYFSGRTAPVITTPSTSSSTVMVDSGSSYTLSCTSTNSPPDTFTWRKDNGPVLNSITTPVIYTDSMAMFHANYSIDSVTMSDSGTYTCTVTNPIGSASATITVVVIVSCPLLTAPTSGGINCSLGGDAIPNPGDTCTVTCDDDYELTGSATRTCQSSGSWDGSNAICIAPPGSGDDTILNNVTISPSGPIQGAMVGSRQVINCTVSTIREIESSSVMFSWRRPGGGSITSDSRVTISPTTSSDNISHTSSLQFTYLMEGDRGNYTCNVTLLLATGSRSVVIESLTITTPNVTVIPPNIQTVGQSLTLPCEVTAVRGITSSVDIVWSSGGTELNRTKNASSTTMGNSLVYTDSYTISQLNTTDDGRVIQCEVVINATPPVMASDSITLDVTVPDPAVIISPSGPIQNAMVSSPQVINCTVSTVSGVESSSVMISWMGPRGNINATNGRVSIGSVTAGGNNTYTRSLQFTYLMEGDEGTYTCNVMILDTSESQSVELQSLTIPIPTVTVTAPNSQTVGNSLMMQCDVTTVRGITSRVDIVWSSNGTELERMNGVSSTTVDNLLVYTDSYTISQLSTTDYGRVIQCEVVINRNSLANDIITLDVTVPNFAVTISSSSLIQGATVGSPQVINCTVSTVSGVEFSSVMISWMVPGGNINATNDRVSIGSVTAGGNNMYTRSLQFTYLMEGDEGTYTCNVMILETSGSQSVELQSLTIPTPNVSATAPNTQTVGQSLTLQCEVTTVRGISSRVDIVWSNDGTQLNRTNGTKSTTMDNLLVYTDSYSISQLNTTDNDRMIQCEGIIQITPVQSTTSNTLALDITVPQPSITISQSVDSPNVGQNHILTCTVTVANGVSSSLVEVNWSGGASLSNSSRVTVSNVTNNGSQYTTMITFSPLLSSDGGQYNCSVSVNGFDEADNSFSRMIDVSGLPVVTVMPSSQSVEVTHNATFTTMVTGVGNITYQWRHNETVINGETGDTLIVKNLVLNDTGMYTCTVMNQYKDSNSSSALLIVIVTPPNITIHPMDAIIQLYSNFINHTLTCKADETSSYSMMLYNWERQNGNISSDSTGVNTSTLTLINLQPEDAGNYRCVATNASGSRESNYANLTINVTSPRIIEHPMDREVPLAETAMFMCVGQGYGFVDVSWHVGGGKRGRSPPERSIVNTMVTPDNFATITSMFSLPNVTQEDHRTQYRCRYNNSQGETDSSIVRLTIGIPPPVIISDPMAIIADNGSNVMFNCTSFSYENISYTWLKNGNTTLRDGAKYIISSNPEGSNTFTVTLMILDVRLSDNGVYVCSVTNREGTASSTAATLSVIVPPVITLHPNSSVTNEKGIATLSCNATSIVDIIFHWEKLDNDTWGPLPSSTSLVGMNTMTISSINIQQSDEGSYQCTASNSAGTSISDVATITVYGPPKIVSLLPDNATVVEGENVSFVCEAVNDPDAIENVTVRWFADNNQRITDHDGRITISSTTETHPSRNVMSTLAIDPVIHQDTGQYRCVALNHPELMVSDTTQLTVQFTPIVTIEAMDKILQSEVNVTFNTMFKMNCSVESYPLVVAIYWEEDGIQLNDNLEIRMDTKVLEEVTVDTSSRGAIITYTCVAVNEINEVNHSANNSINVIIQDIPDVIPTDDITQHERTVTSVVVQWKVPNYYNAPITMYSLNLCQKVNDVCTPVNGNYPMNINVSDINVIESNRSIVRYNISGLQPFSSTPYLFSIRAINDIGSANFSEPVALILVSRMEAAVYNLTLMPLNNSEVMATWNVNLDLFELSFFNVTYFTKPEQQQSQMVIGNSHQISDLIPGETYTVRVTAYYSETTGSRLFPADTIEETVSIKRIETTPPTISELALPDNNNDPVFLSWTPPVLTDDNREFFEGYNVSFSRDVIQTTLSQRRKRNTLESERNTIRLGPNATNHTFSIICPYSDSLTLCPYSRYCFSVISVFEFRGTPIDVSDSTLTTMCSSTDEAAPSDPPQEFSNSSTEADIHEIRIRWKFPQFPNGVITGFTVYYNNRVLLVSTSNCDISTLSCSAIINNLIPFTPYIIEVSCSTGAGEGPNTTSVRVNTTIGMPTVMNPDEPLSVSSQAISSQSTSLKIEIPEFNKDDGPISHYFIVVINASLSNTISSANIRNNQLVPHSSSTQYYVAAVLSDNEYNHNEPFVLGNESITEFEGVSYVNAPITLGEYRYFVRAYTVGPRLSGDSQVSEEFTISRASEGDDDDDSGVGVIIGAIAGVAFILLIVLIILIILAIITRRRGQRTSAAKLDDAESIEMRKQGSPASPAARNTAPIINIATVEVTTSVNQPTTLFIETTGNPPAEIEWNKDGSPVNHPIMSDGSLYIMHTEPSDQGEYTVTATNPVGSSQQVITVTVIQPVALHPDPDHKVVKKDDFAQHMALLRSDMEEGFKMEYESLDMAEWEFTQYNAKVTVNKNKNRYINIIPYDHSRVVLNIQDNTAGSDYINASFVNGHNEKYVATQGPIPSSYGDFWRMIWENESATIVMLTNLKEDDRVKCHQYWPSYGSAMYGNFQVTLRDVENLAEYSVRSFSVQPIAGTADYKDDMREVRQFHFTVWPDHGVPKYGTALLSFQKRIDKYHDRKRHGPMVVHCSAGVGRTGTFITIDTQLQRIKDEGTVDIFNFVRHLRYCRNYMVQTQAQYVFLHDALLEALMCGDTSIAAPVKDAKEKVAELAKVDPKTGKTGFETQFENLIKSSPPEDSFECNVARLPDNMRKNRFPNYLPSDVDRVVLSTDNDQSDYINACFLDGYRHRNAFIGTQGPMMETIGDFWRMIWEHKSYAIIMLTELQESGKEMCCQYWPDPGMTLTYGTCVVDNVGEDQPRQEYIKRSFRLALASNPTDTRTITQFHFQQWPVNSCPNNPASIIDLFEGMERVQRKTGNGPITAHCNDGIGRTGTFCALAATLERFKTEQMVDVFHTIKTIRIQRAGMVQTLDQYEFIHKTLLQYMTSFELYDNFS